MTTTDATRLAVLIDSDNTTASLTTELLEEIAKYGTPTVKRAYGDWTTQNLVKWKDELLRGPVAVGTLDRRRPVLGDLLQQLRGEARRRVVGVDEHGEARCVGGGHETILPYSAA